jgi:excisionase family DNA binding protein
MVYGKIEMAPEGNEVVRRGFRIAEAAEYMGVSPRFVELKIRSKELPALKMCRHWTVLREDMDAFLDAKRFTNGLGNSPNGIRTRNLHLERVTS